MNGRRPAKPRPRARLEWATFAASVAIVTSLIGVILYLWATGATAPSLSTRIDGTTAGDMGDELVHATITNDGDATAADVVVRATFVDDTGDTVEAAQTIDFLAGGESVHLVFVVDAPATDINVRVAGYRDP